MNFKFKFYLAILLAALGFSVKSFAYVISTNSNGILLSWPGGSASPTFYARWKNASGLSYGDIFNSFTNAFSRWKYTGAANVNFDYWQGANAATPASYGYDGRNAVFFSSESSQKLGASTIGITYVYSSNGVILETDVEFNDDDFHFTTTASDSSRFGSNVFLENVATHEFGHAYGLSHSASLQSTMLYLEYRNQYRLSCDDIHGIASLYPSSGFANARGTISGTVQTAGAVNVFGAHVIAISKTRGVALAAAVSQSNGAFTISNVEPGDYYLFAEPFGISSPLSSLCGGSATNCSYGTVNSNSVCSSGTAPFKRGFFESVAGTAQAFNVSAGSTTNAGTYTVSCSSMTGGSASTSIAAADAAGPIVSNSSSASIAKTMVIGGLGTNHYFKLSNVSGNISAKVISYSLYSPFNPSVSIVDSADTVVAGSNSTDNDFSSASSLYTNYDSKASFDNAPSGTYYVRVTNAGPLATTNYPAGNSVAGQVDSVRFYLLELTIGDNTTLLSVPANNARCESSDSFPAFADHGVPPEPPATSTGGSSSGSATPPASSSKVFGCGMIQNGSQKHHGPDRSALFDVWGLVAMMFSFRIFQKLARKRAR